MGINRRQTLPCRPATTFLVGQVADQEEQTVLLRFFRRAPGILGRSLSLAVVQAGYKTTGISPLVEANVLNQCSTWSTTSPSDAQKVRDAIIPCTQEFLRAGWVTDATMDELDVPERQAEKSYWKKVSTS